MHNFCIVQYSFDTLGHSLDFFYVTVQSLFTCSYLIPNVFFLKKVLWSIQAALFETGWTMYLSSF